MAVQQARSQTPFFEPKMGSVPVQKMVSNRPTAIVTHPHPNYMHQVMPHADGGDPREEGDNTNGTEGTEAQVDGRDQEGPPPELGGQAGAQHSEHAHDGNRTQEGLLGAL